MKIFINIRTNNVLNPFLESIIQSKPLALYSIRGQLYNSKVIILYFIQFIMKI